MGLLDRLFGTSAANRSQPKAPPRPAKPSAPAPEVKSATLTAGEPVPTEKPVAPTEEIVTPVAEKPAEVVEEAAPVAEATAQVAEKPTEVAEDVPPVAEEATPVAEETAQVAKKPTEVAENVPPVAEEATPVAEETAQVAEETAKVGKMTVQAPEQAAEVAEKPAPAVETAAPEIDDALERRLDTYFARLRQEYPDGHITRLNTGHKKLAERGAQLRRLMGYEGRLDEFFALGGFTYHRTAGGRPTLPADQTASVEDRLRERFPEDVPTVLAVQQADHRLYLDLRAAARLAGCSVGDYLQQFKE